MKVKAVFRKTVCWFDFFVDEIIGTEQNGPAKTVLVKTSVLTESKEEIWSGTISTVINEFGIYPDPAELAAIPIPDSIRKMLLIELRRYIKPQKAFL